LLEFLKEHTKPSECHMAGNSIYSDKVFLSKYMPMVIKHLHYRIVDVSSIKELIKRWYPEKELQKIPRKNANHLALDDIRESISELKYYKKHFFE